MVEPAELLVVAAAVGVLTCASIPGTIIGAGAAASIACFRA
jgi:hypothetical protein